MRDVTMEASRQRRSIWWWFWTYFVVNTCNITLFSHVPAPDNKSLGCCCHNSLPTVINSLIITWWWVLYSCRNSMFWQKSPCFDRKSPSVNSCYLTYPLIHRSLVNSPHKSQWCGALMFSLIFSWTNSWEKNRDASDLRRHHAHCDITLMWE